MPNTDPAFVRDLSDEKMEALVEMMYLAAAADGDFGPEERAQFAVNAEKLTGKIIAGEKLEELLGRAERQLEASSREARLAAVKERLPDHGARKIALSLAIQISAADGIVRTSERELIMDTAIALDIDVDIAADMVRDILGK